LRLASETHAASEDEECEGVEGAEDAKTHVKTHLRADEAAAGTQPQEPRQPERMRRERMKPDDMGALVRAVAYLNIADRRLLCSASTALLQRSAAAEALTDGLGPVSAAGAPGTGGGGGQVQHAADGSECGVGGGRDWGRGCFSAYVAGHVSARGAAPRAVCGAGVLLLCF